MKPKEKAELRIQSRQTLEPPPPSSSPQIPAPHLRANGKKSLEFTQRFRFKNWLSIAELGDYGQVTNPTALMGWWAFR